MMRTGNVVTLDVARQGAIYHGLATLLSQPSPVMAKHGPPVVQQQPPFVNGGVDYGTGPRRMSERDLRGGPVVPDMRATPSDLRQFPPAGSARIPQSKSTPALHHSPEGGQQHNYQNQEWLHHQMGPPGTNR